MSCTHRGIADFVSPLPQAPVPSRVLEKFVSENRRVQSLNLLEKRWHGNEPFIYDFIITFDGATYELRFEDSAWTVNEAE